MTQCTVSGILQFTCGKMFCKTLKAIAYLCGADSFLTMPTTIYLRGPIDSSEATATDAKGLVFNPTDTRTPNLRDFFHGPLSMGWMVHWHIVGSTDLQSGFNSHSSLWICVLTLSNLYALPAIDITCALANQSINPYWSVNWYQLLAICLGR